MDSVIINFIKEHSDVELSIDRYVVPNGCIKFTMCDYFSAVRVSHEIDVSMLTQLKDTDSWMSVMLDDMYMKLKDWRAQHGNS